MTIRPELLDELLKDYKTPQDLLGEDGIIKQLRHRDDRALPANGDGRASGLSQARA